MKLEFREAVVENGPALELSEGKNAEGAAPGKGRWSRTCEDLAEQYKLSPRQKEIFLLLAKGRNVQFIKDELVLSTPTVKSHVYNIYQKMGVHSHQEPARSGGKGSQGFVSGATRVGEGGGMCGPCCRTRARGALCCAQAGRCVCGAGRCAAAAQVGWCACCLARPPF